MGARWLWVVSILAVLATANPAAGAPTSSAQWSYTKSGVTCAFAGIHSRENGFAYADTNDANGGCAGLKVRLKYKRTSDGAVIDGGWSPWSPSTASSIRALAPVSSTAKASQHQAQNNFDLSPSPVEQPHTF